MTDRQDDDSTPTPDGPSAPRASRVYRVGAVLPAEKWEEQAAYLRSRKCYDMATSVDVLAEISRRTGLPVGRVVDVYTDEEGTRP